MMVVAHQVAGAKRLGDGGHYIFARGAHSRRWPGLNLRQARISGHPALDNDLHIAICTASCISRAARDDKYVPKEVRARGGGSKNLS